MTECCLLPKSCPILLWPPWTVVCQTPLSMEFSRQEYWSGFPFPSPGGSSWPRDWTCISCIGRQILHQWSFKLIPIGFLPFFFGKVQHPEETLKQRLVEYYKKYVQKRSHVEDCSAPSRRIKRREAVAAPTTPRHPDAGPTAVCLCQMFWAEVGGFSSPHKESSELSAPLSQYARCWGAGGNCSPVTLVTSELAGCFFFSSKNKCCAAWKSKLEFQPGKYTHAVCTLSHKHRQQSLSLASGPGKEAEWG